jgi:hypothetical protein
VAILSGINAIAIFLLVPETQYFRKYDVGHITPENELFEEKGVNTSESNVDVPTITSAIPKKSFLEGLKPWSHINPDSSYLALFIRPWPLLAYPAVIYSFLTFSATVGWTICLLDTNPSILQAPPYNMSPGINSLIYLACFVGIVIGTYIGGPLTDRMAEWSARRNGGVFEPEIRLLAMIFPFFITPIGLLMYSSPLFSLTPFSMKQLMIYMQVRYWCSKS